MRSNKNPYSRYIARENRREQQPTITGLLITIGCVIFIWLGLIAAGAVGALIAHSCPPILWVLLVVGMLITAAVIGYVTGKERGRA